MSFLEVEVEERPRTTPKALLIGIGAILVTAFVVSVVVVANETPTSEETNLNFDVDGEAPPTPTQLAAAPTTKLYGSRRRASFSSGRRRASFSSGRRRYGGSVIISSGRRRYGFYDSRRRYGYYVSIGRRRRLACFPASAKVNSKKRGEVPIAEVKVGEQVQTHQGYSEVLFFAKLNPQVKAEHVKITTENATLTLSPSHGLFHADGTPVLAKRVKEGHVLLTAGLVTKVERLNSKGLVAPVTAHGTLVVDGVTTSDYGPLAEWAGQGAAHVALAPLRLLRWAAPGLDLWHGGHDADGTHPLMRWGQKLFQF